MPRDPFNTLFANLEGLNGPEQDRLLACAKMLNNPNSDIEITSAGGATREWLKHPNPVVAQRSRDLFERRFWTISDQFTNDVWHSGLGAIVETAEVQPFELDTQDVSIRAAIVPGGVAGVTLFTDIDKPVPPRLSFYVQEGEKPAVMLVEGVGSFNQLAKLVDSAARLIADPAGINDKIIARPTARPF